MIEDIELINKMKEAIYNSVRIYESLFYRVLIEKDEKARQQLRQLAKEYFDIEVGEEEQ